jgi:hypothetical protein
MGAARDPCQLAESMVHAHGFDQGAAGEEGKEKADAWVKDIPMRRMANPIKSCFIEPCPVLACLVAIIRVI